MVSRCWFERALSSQFEEGGKDPLGQTPDEVTGPQMVGREEPFLAPDLERGIAVDRGIAELAERHPEGVGDLAVGGEWGALRDPEDEGAYENEAPARSAGPDIVERAEEVVAGKGETNLLDRLAHRSDTEVGVGGIVTSAGEPDVSGPGVPFALGAADQEDAVGAWSEDDRDRREWRRSSFVIRSLLNLGRLPRAESFREYRLQRTQWQPHPPPPQPPPPPAFGGPRLV